MLKESITARDVVDLLNEMLRLDPEATRNFISARVNCSELLAHHPSIQVGKYHSDHYQVGPIGFLNGLFGTNKHGFGAIAGILEEDGTLKEFIYNPDLHS